LFHVAPATAGGKDGFVPLFPDDGFATRNSKC
jgi:hypothetical protein